MGVGTLFWTVSSRILFNLNNVSIQQIHFLVFTCYINRNVSNPYNRQWLEYIYLNFMQLVWNYSKVIMSVLFGSSPQIEASIYISMFYNGILWKAHMNLNKNGPNNKLYSVPVSLLTLSQRSWCMCDPTWTEEVLCEGVVRWREDLILLKQSSWCCAVSQNTPTVLDLGNHTWFWKRITWIINCC